MKEENKTTEFQITQNYGDGCIGCIYFEADVFKTIDQLKKMAIEAMLDDRNNIIPALYFAAPKPARPTVEVAEYADGKKVKNGIRFKCKWR